MIRYEIVGGFRSPSGSSVSPQRLAWKSRRPFFVPEMPCLAEHVILKTTSELIPCRFGGVGPKRWATGEKSVRPPPALEARVLHQPDPARASSADPFTRWVAALCGDKASHTTMNASMSHPVSTPR
jgi:hypothetical protein